MISYNKKSVVLLLCIYFVAGVRLAFSQTWSLPDNRKNTRFTSDYFDIPRPALSMRSFDNTKNDVYQHQYSSTTFGVRQVLEKAYGIGQVQDATVEQPFRRILALHDDGFHAFTTDNAEYNSAVLESQAFIALMTFIIEKNDGEANEPDIFTSSVKSKFDNMPSHSDARTRFINALRGKGDYFRKDDKDNAFKRSRPLMKVARAWDLYLALENAYQDLGGSLSLLLNSSDKQWWNDAIHVEMKKLWQDSNGNLPTIEEWDGWSAGLQMHEVQAGNWPLISFVALGYAALGFNGSFAKFSDDNSSSLKGPSEILARAMKSVAFHYTDSGDKRFNYWWYQTGEGKPFWAEGAYYFEVALPRVLEFWHIIRANNMLSFSSHGDGIDPFHYSRFLEPLKWHANISTPDGNTPPFDDGNKTSISSSTLLSWSSAYGNVPTGEKFTFIRDLPEIGGPGAIRDHRLVEIAIPRLPIGSGTVPPSNYGNTSSTSRWHKQTVIRRNDSEGRLHYIFMNGESGDAISRGEGHEQADQLQLLYYVDKGSNKESSYLMDTGYDKATGDKNSTWNLYHLHNLMSFDNAPDGGLKGPYLSPDKTRKISAHASVDSLFFSNYGAVTTLEGNIKIKHYNTNWQHIFTTSTSRKVLVVSQNSNYTIQPYIIDIASNDNRPAQLSDYEKLRHQIHMRYYSDTQSYTHSVNNWSRFEHGTDDLYLFTDYIESEMRGEFTLYKKDYLAREENGRDIGNDQEGYPVTYREVRSANLDSESMNILSMMYISNSSPSLTPSKLFAYADDHYTRSHQGWYWKHDANTVDVIVKRSKVNMTKYNQNIDFDVDANGIFIPGIRLPAGKDYGFARFRKINGVWDIDSNYQINITRVPGMFVYSTNSSVGTKTYPSNAKIYIGDSSTLTITGNVTLQPGTMVYIGYDASIDVQSGGTITADGTTFQMINGAHWNHIKLLGGGSSFTDCRFEGGSDGLYNYAGSNTVLRGTFLNNDRSGYVAGGTLTLKGTYIDHVSNSGTGVLVRGDGWLVTRAWQDGGDISTFTPTRIEDAMTGISIYDYGNARLKHTRLLNNFFYHVVLSGEGELFAGYYGGFASEGYNSFAPGAYYDISNSAITAQARYNWWGEASEPADSRFYGSVDRAHPLSCDPTLDGYYCSAIDEDGWDPGYCTGTGCFESNTTPIPILSKASQNPGSSTPSADSSEEPVKQRLSEIFTHIAEQPGDPAFAGLVREAYGLLQLYDPDGSVRRWVEWDTYLQRWRELYIRSKSGGPVLDKHPLLKYPANLVRVGETAMLLTLSDALHASDYDAVFELSEIYAPYLENPDYRASLLAARAIAWERTKQFGKALAAYEAMEQLIPEEGLPADYAAPDYSVIKEELEDSMAARQQVKGKVPEVMPGKLAQQEITEVSIEVPYPNPFVRTVVIPIELPSPSRVRIEIHNTLGQLVKVLVDREYGTGAHSVPFAASGLSSGVYFIRTYIDEEIYTQKVTLVK